MKTKAFYFTDDVYNKVTGVKESAGLAVGGLYNSVYIKVSSNTYNEHVINATVHELGHKFDEYFEYKTGTKLRDKPEMVALFNKYKDKSDQNRPLSSGCYKNSAEFIAGMTSAYYVQKYKKISNVGGYNTMTSDMIQVYEKYVNEAKEMHRG